ncbi:MAG: hypothetical protein FWH19_05340 [Treponema sp.]|nr:hypothetical protein [Treponema sp.]
MKKKFFLSALLLSLAVVGFVFVSCGDGAGGGSSGSGLSGSTWVDEYGDSEVRFTSGSNYNVRIWGEEMARGTYSVSGSIINCTLTWVTPFFSAFGLNTGYRYTYTILNDNTIRDDDDGSIYYRR